MPIWELLPADLRYPDWRASRHQGRTVVRAASEARAREVAEEAFYAGPKFVSGHGLTFSPWCNPSLVWVRLLADPVFPEDGPEGVLFPLSSGA
jgi:hypothetical protein